MNLVFNDMMYGMLALGICTLLLPEKSDLMAVQSLL